MMTREDFFKQLNEHAIVLQTMAARLAPSQEEAHKLYLETIYQALKNLGGASRHQGFKPWVVLTMSHVFRTGLVYRA